MITTYKPADFLAELPYSVREARGVTFLVVVACITLVAVVGLIVVISISAFHTWSALDEHLFVRSHIAAYFLCLLLSDLFQVISSIMNATWLNANKVYVGGVCTTQATFKQLSDVSISFWTLVITVHIFCQLVFELRPRRFILFSTLIAGWFSIGTIVIAGPATMNVKERGYFYGISGYWCWINEEYVVQRVTLDFMFVFFSAISSFILYTLIFLKLSGRLMVNGWQISLWWRPITKVQSWRAGKEDSQSEMIAKQMLLVPVAYTIIFFPIALAKLSAFTGNDASLEITIFCATLYLLSGLVNVVLFSCSRNILPKSNLTIKKWSISVPKALSTEWKEGDGPDPYYGPYAPSESFHRTPTEEKERRERGGHDEEYEFNPYDFDLPQISPLSIQKGERRVGGGGGRAPSPPPLPPPPRESMDAITPPPTARPPTRSDTLATTDSSGSDYDEGIIAAYDDVDLEDTPVLTPTVPCTSPQRDSDTDSVYSASTAW